MADLNVPKHNIFICPRSGTVAFVQTARSKTITGFLDYTDVCNMALRKQIVLKIESLCQFKENVGCMDKAVYQFWKGPCSDKRRRRNSLDMASRRIHSAILQPEPASLPCGTPQTNYYDTLRSPNYSSTAQKPGCFNSAK